MAVWQVQLVRQTDRQKALELNPNCRWTILHLDFLILRLVRKIGNHLEATCTLTMEGRLGLLIVISETHCDHSQPRGRERGTWPHLGRLVSLSFPESQSTQNQTIATLARILYTQWRNISELWSDSIRCHTSLHVRRKAGVRLAQAWWWL